MTSAGSAEIALPSRLAGAVWGHLVGNAVGVLAGTGVVVAFALLWRVTHLRTEPAAYSATRRRSST